LQSFDPKFSIKPLLDTLRAERGDSEFGYRMQGLFAHVLIRLGGIVLEVNAQGHPDIKANLGGDLLIVQVKSVLHANSFSGFQLSSADLAGISPTELSKGYLALLDCADPVSWVIINFSKLRQFLDLSVPIAALYAAQETHLSNDCTNEFSELIISVKDRLNTLTFPLLVRRAIEGRTL
jgi:hypothetical protein